MTLEDNKAIARRWNDVWAGDLSAIDEVFGADFAFHYASPGVEPDREAYRDNVIYWHSRFAEIQATLEDMVAEGDKVAVRCTWRGKHRGEYLGIAPTGKEVTTTGISMLRIVGGRIVEEWGEIDSLGLMRRLGGYPPPELAGGTCLPPLSKRRTGSKLELLATASLSTAIDANL